jgi:hypothetical protein
MVQSRYNQTKRHRSNYKPTCKNNIFKFRLQHIRAYEKGLHTAIYLSNVRKAKCMMDADENRTSKLFMIQHISDPMSCFKFTNSLAMLKGITNSPTHKSIVAKGVSINRVKNLCLRLQVKLTIITTFKEIAAKHKTLKIVNKTDFETTFKTLVLLVEHE